jgi:PAS domain S-box-containing protein
MTILRLIFILLLSSQLCAQQVEGLKVNTSLYIDKTGSLAITDLQELLPKFVPVQHQELAFGPGNGTIWMRFDFENRSENEKNIVLEIENLLINPHFYLLRHTDSGSVWEFEPTKEINKHSHTLSVSCTRNGTASYIMKVETSGFPTAIPLEVRTSEDFNLHHTMHTLIIGLVMGVMLIIILLSMILWFIGQSKMSAFLFAFMTVTTVYFFIMDGLPFLFIGYEHIGQTIIFAKSLLPLAVGFLGLYLNEFYEINQINKSRYNLFRIVGLSLIFIFTLFVIFRNYSETLYILSYPIITIGIIYNIAILLYAKVKKVNHIYSMFMGLAIFSVFLILKFLFDYGLIPLNTITIQFPKIGFASLIVFTSFSLADRFRQRSNDLKSLNYKLDVLVKERTAEINNQNEELKTQTEELNTQREELETQKEELEAQTEELIVQKEMLQRQNTELERLQLVASKTDNVIYIFDPDGTLVWFNSSFSSQLGLTYEEFVAKNQQIKIHDISTNHDIGKFLERCLTSKSSSSYESKVSDSLGRDHWYQTTLTPIFEDEYIKYVVAIDSEITKLKQYEFEVEHQRNLAINRKNELEYQQTEMTDSLRYAQRIQSAILPQSKDIKRFFPESFLLFEPKDIVSGDFYWFHRIENKYIFIAVDCTGHGVPGAFMSIIGTYLLNNIIIQNNETRPAEILKQLNRKLKISLKNESPLRQTNDGMDVSLVTIDMDTKKLYYAGALRPLFLCTQGDFIEVKGDKIPITSEIVGNVMAPFKEWEFDVASGDRFYMFSDGIIDQFGGKDNKKFLTKRFKQLVLDAQSYPMSEQMKLIQQANMDWRGKTPQIDDILVLGVQI